jgi:hypothetical protein
LYVSANLLVCDLRVWYDKSYNSSGRMAMSSKLRKGVIVCSFRTKFEGILSGEFRCPSLFVKALKTGLRRGGKGGLDARPENTKINASYANKRGG